MRKMKDSGIEWIGQIPEDWKVVSLKRIKDDQHPYPIGDGDHGSIKPEHYIDNGVPYIRVQNLSWGQELLLDDVAYISEDVNRANEKSILKPHDILIAKTGATIGKTGIIPDYMQIANTTSSVGKVTVSPKHSYKFIFYVLSSDVCFQQMWEKAKQKSAQPGFNIEDLVEFKIPLTNYEKQHSIATYLDTKCSEIDSIVRETEQTIEEYKKLKQSFITEVVTGKKRVAADGISLSNDPRKMKDSGVEWIGEIPEEWQRVKIRYLHKGLTDGTHGTYARQDKGRLLLSSKNVREEDIEIGDNESYISEEDYQSIVANGFPQKNDVLMCCIGASIGRCIIYKLDDIHAFQRSVVFIRCNDKILPSLMRYNLKSNTTLIQESFLINQSAQAGLYQGLVKEIYVVVPKQSEQQLIISYLDAKCSEIDKLIADKQTLLQELDTYKKSLIYECVTGKREIN